VAGQPKAVLRLGVIKELKTAGGRRFSFSASRASSAKSLVVPGCPGFALAMTGFPDATAAAKSPPAAGLKANGKLLGPKMTTGPPSGPCLERRLFLVSIVARHQERSRQAAAAWRN